MDFQWSEEQQAIHGEIKKFAKRELNEGLLERDKKGVFHHDGWKKSAQIGIQGLPVPQKYGGEGCDILTTIYAMQALGNGCSDNGLVHAINSHMWGCEIPIWKFGTETQKEKYLQSLCNGKIIGGHALTEPDAGSDVFSIVTDAKKKNGYYLINGSKSIVSNGPVADLVIVFARTSKNRSFLGGMSAFIIEKNETGISIGQPLEKMGLKTGPISEMFFDNCTVPAENLLGSEGAGIKIFYETMAFERSCLFACLLGALERIIEACVEYSKSRRQFGKPIGKYQSISHKMADMKKNLELGKLMLYKIGWLKTKNKDVLMETSIAKLFISESLKAAASDAIQIHGAYGYMTESGIERELRDAIASTIYSGTSEIQRNIIAKQLGL